MRSAARCPRGRRSRGRPPRLRGPGAPGGGRPAGEGESLGRSLPWGGGSREGPAAFGGARGRGWRLAILSNTDPDFIEALKARLGVPFDETVVASELGSYKPAHRHWEEFFARTGAPREGHVHVAASRFHDIAPARELGLRTIWINRFSEAPEPPPDRELPDLARLADTLEELVPAPAT